MTKLVSEIKDDQENASHLSLQLTTERENTELTSKSLKNCEELLKKFSDKSEQLSRENNVLTDNVRELKTHSTRNDLSDSVRKKLILKI